MSSQLIIPCNSGDCWVDKFNNFDDVGTVLYVGDSAAAANRDVRTWIPFTVNLPRGTVIEQAYLTLTASSTSNATVFTVNIGCEAADNPSTPIDGADANGRSKGTYTNNVSLPQFVANNEVTWQIDNPIQEVLERPGFVYGNTLAVIIDDVDVTDKPHRAYSYEGDPAKRPYLTLNVVTYVPRTVGLI